MDVNRKRLHTGLPGSGACALALVFAAGAGHPVAAATQDVLTAHPAVRYDPKDRCPDLRVSDEGDTVAVLFMVDAYGAPSRASVRAPSGVAGLDAAAVACVMKLRYQPATRPGDAQPLESWQQITLRYAAQVHATAASTPLAAPLAAAAAVTGATAATAGVAGAGVPAGSGTSSVHVCADAAGKLTQEPVVTHSSGDAALDAAAVKIARSGAGNYRPAGVPNASGCAQVNITFETR